MLGTQEQETLLSTDNVPVLALGATIERRADELLSRFHDAAKFRFRFSYRELTFEALVTKPAPNKQEGLQLYSEIAHLPYSAENYEKRQTLLLLLQKMERPQLAFSLHLSPQQKIVLRAHYPMAHQNPPDFIFHPILQFTQEVNPFLDLIERYI